MLSAPATFAEIVRVGRIRRQASQISRFLTSHSQVVLTSIPEEMAVAETIEAIRPLRKAGATVAAIVANRCLPGALPSGKALALGRLRPEDVATLSAEAGLELGHAQAAVLLDAAGDDVARRRAQRRFLTKLSAAGPVLELPDLQGLEGPAQVNALAGWRHRDSPPRSKVPTSSWSAGREASGRRPWRRRWPSISPRSNGGPPC